MNGAGAGYGRGCRETCDLETGGLEAGEEIVADAGVEGFALDFARSFVLGDVEVEFQGGVGDGADLVGGVDEIPAYIMSLVVQT